MDRNLGSRDVNYNANGEPLLYQFGRVAPHPGGPNSGTSGYLGTTKVAYNPTSYTRSTTSTLRVGISSPLTYYTPAGNWNSEVTANSYTWHDIKVGTTANAKSIFDPSPAGWRIPRDGVWASFSTSTLARVWTGTIGGTYRSIAYYPASGWRWYTTALVSDVGSWCYAYSSTPYSEGTVINLQVSPSAVTPSYISRQRTFAIPVRPISER